jgi:hypothetical protein
MKFQINGVNYRARFGYENSAKEFGGTALQHSHQYPVTTLAEIQYKPDKTGDGEWKTLVVGKTTCSIKDNFAKNTGRKTALTRALQREELRDLISKKDRKEVWRAYFKTHAGVKPDWFYNDDDETQKASTIAKAFEGLSEKVRAKVLSLVKG